ncbi:MAG: anhydro-N-acetylmuramic acid kinase, partial [Planctomycetota bacterium]
ALGLMSGMSADGLDLALVRIEGRGERPGVTLLAHATRPYEPALSRRTHAAVTGPTREVSRLDFLLARWWADAVAAFLAAHDVAAADVGVVGSHGQTLDHVPRRAGQGATTLQVGDGCVLAERTGIPTVSDFRPRDVAAGGEGAPLVPYADWVLHAQPGAVVLTLNLGSIANVTVVTERLQDVVAFDCGPANALIDGFVRRASGEERGIDRDGGISARGRLVEAVLADLDAASRAFLDRPPPRSAGYDEFGPALAARLGRQHASVAREDLVRTAVEFTARTVAGALERFVLPAHPRARTVLLTGGGAKNPTLVGALRAHLGARGLEVAVAPGPWIDAKEAVAFALLADATLRGVPAGVPGATGAARAVLLGKISP